MNISIPKEIHPGEKRVAATPEVVKAAFTKEGDIFKDHGIEYWDPVVDMYRPALAEKQMHKYFGERLGISKEENKKASSWQRWS